MPRRDNILWLLAISSVLVFSSCQTIDKNEGQEETTTEPEKPETTVEEELLSFYKGPEDTERALSLIEKRASGYMDRDSRFVYFSLLLSKNDIEGAIAQLEILLNENPYDLTALGAYANLMDYKGMEKERDQALSTILAKDPSNGDALVMKGNLSLRNKNYGAAEASYDKILKLENNNIQALMGMGNALMHQEGREEESLIYLDAALKNDGSNLFAYGDRARVHRFLKDYGKAEDDLSRAIELGGDQWFYLDRARIRISDLGDQEGAVSDLQVVLSMDSDDFFANVYMAGIEEERGNYDLSFDHYQKVISLEKDYYYAYPALGKIYFLRGEMEKGAQMFSLAMDYGADDLVYPLMSSLCYKMSGDEKKAKTILNRYIGKLDRNTSLYEMYRYYLNPGSPYFAQLAIDKEENKIFGARMKFYLAMIDRVKGNVETSKRILSVVAENKGSYEFELAGRLMENK